MTVRKNPNRKPWYIPFDFELQAFNPHNAPPEYRSVGKRMTYKRLREMAKEYKAKIKLQKAVEAAICQVAKDFQP